MGKERRVYRFYIIAIAATIIYQKNIIHLCYKTIPYQDSIIVVGSLLLYIYTP